ncbi:MAG: Uma2 family endonuclease [Blastocatellia bacterium]|nr:Uma2 family endonuclease [Blastocatellia bacterium]
MSALPRHKYTLEEYFDFIQTAEGRWEYWEGELFDMSGASEAHYEIEGNFLSCLKAPLVTRGCRAFTSNTAIKVPSLPPFRFSDFAALCGQAVFEKVGGIDVLTNPALIVEVLSKSTEAYDRGDKFSHYQSIPSFCEYLLVAQHRPHVAQLVKQANGSWNYYEYNALEDVVTLASVGVTLKLQDIYLGVTFDGKLQYPSLRPLG